MGARRYTEISTVVFEEGEIAIEIGAERGEGSTHYLSVFCDLHGVPFYSIDVVKRTPSTIVMDGAEWLEQNKDPIKFAYLDNYDYIYRHLLGTEHLKRQKEEYKALGMELTNKASQEAHLQQSQLIHEKAPIGAVIVLDDTWFKAKYRGKGGTAVPWLVEHGWEPSKHAQCVVLRRMK